MCINLETCLLAIAMLHKSFSALMCVSFMLEKVLWYLLLSSSSVLQSLIQSSLLIMVMTHSLSASFITERSLERFLLAYR